MRRGSTSAIDGDAEIIFFGDVDARRDDQHIHRNAFRPGLHTRRPLPRRFPFNRKNW